MGWGSTSPRSSKAENRCGQSEAKLLQAQKMESIGTLAGGVAHDFNNLLTVILGNTQMVPPLGSNPAGSPRHRRLLQVEKAGERASALTQATTGLQPSARFWRKKTSTLTRRSSML
jgi:signal transduction histidine kinase